MTGANGADPPVTSDIGGEGELTASVDAGGVGALAAAVVEVGSV
jgi:hypothetical protein